MESTGKKCDTHCDGEQGPPQADVDVEEITGQENAAYQDQQQAHKDAVMPVMAI